MRACTINAAAIPFVAILLLFAIAGCPSSPAAVGTSCDLGVPTAGGDGVTISSPALECAGGLCLQEGSGPALCSAECGSDDDCSNHAAASTSGCHSGFTCRTTTAFGVYACRRLCVCRDSLPATPACQGTL